MIRPILFEPGGKRGRLAQAVVGTMSLAAVTAPVFAMTPVPPAVGRELPPGLGDRRHPDAANRDGPRAAQAPGVTSVAPWRPESEDPGGRPVPDTFRRGRAAPPDTRRIGPPDGPAVAGSDGNLRAGGRDKLVALAFADGPDPSRTPPVLDALERAHVPATFFVTGRDAFRNALENPGLLRRIVADGDELGVGAGRPGSDATRRLVEAYTGRSAHLFLASSDGIGPALAARGSGYTVVAPPTTSGRSPNLLLLREGDAAALPRIIAGFQARGYRFVPVSTLAGISHAEAMPRVRENDLLAVRAGAAGLLLLSFLAEAAPWALLLAVVLAIGRAAVPAWRRAKPSRAPAAGGSAAG